MDRVQVFQFDVDREVNRVSPEKADRMVKLGQARWIQHGRALRLTHAFSLPLGGGTRTSRGGMLAAIGRSQQYTVRELSPAAGVTGFKRIDALDRHIFALATLEARGIVAA